MGKIFYIMGKSASGKDTIYKELIEKMPQFHSIVPYTTRPMREGEKDGVEYFFVNQERFDEMMDEEKIIEFRSYNTKCGIWTYFTADDGQKVSSFETLRTALSYYAAGESVTITVQRPNGNQYTETQITVTLADRSTITDTTEADTEEGSSEAETQEPQVQMQKAQ